MVLPDKCDLSLFMELLGRWFLNVQLIMWELNAKTDFTLIIVTFGFVVAPPIGRFAPNLVQSLWMTSRTRDLSFILIALTVTQICYNMPFFS